MDLDYPRLLADLLTRLAGTTLEEKLAACRGATRSYLLSLLAVVAQQR